MDTETAAAELVTLQERIAELTMRAAELKAAILADTQPGDVVSIAGTPAWKVTTRRTFREGKARQHLDAGLLAAITVDKIDGAALKRLSPALWEACCDESEPYLAAVR